MPTHFPSFFSSALMYGSAAPPYFADPSIPPGAPPPPPPPNYMSLIPPDGYRPPTYTTPAVSHPFTPRQPPPPLSFWSSGGPILSAAAPSSHPPPPSPRRQSSSPSGGGGTIRSIPMVAASRLPPKRRFRLSDVPPSSTYLLTTSGTPHTGRVGMRSPTRSTPPLPAHQPPFSAASPPEPHKKRYSLPESYYSSVATQPQPWRQLLKPTANGISVPCTTILTTATPVVVGGEPAEIVTEQVAPPPSSLPPMTLVEPAKPKLILTIKEHASGVASCRLDDSLSSSSSSQPASSSNNDHTHRSKKEIILEAVQQKMRQRWLKEKNQLAPPVTFSGLFKEPCLDTFRSVKEAARKAATMTWKTIGHSCQKTTTQQHAECQNDLDKPLTSVSQLDDCKLRCHLVDGFKIFESSKPFPVAMTREFVTELSDLTSAGTHTVSHIHAQLVLPSDHAVRPLSRWTVDEVCAFVASIPGVCAYTEVFRDNEVDGEVLAIVDVDQLISSPIHMKVGPAIKLFYFAKYFLQSRCVKSMAATTTTTPVMVVAAGVGGVNLIK